MIWDGETNSDDIVSDITFLTGADETVAYPLADRSRNANRGLDRATALILQCDGMQPHDDTSNTGTEILDVTGNLVSGTGKYATSITWLKRGRVRIKDSAGNWITLPQVNRNDLTDAQLVASGTPTSYHIMGNWVYLRPTPNYASTAGLEIQYQRGASYFVPTDTTKTPGFASHLHRLIPLYASFDYCEVNDLEKRSAKILGMIQRLEADLISHYSQRDTDTKVSFSTIREDYGERALLNDTNSSSPHGFLI